MLVIFEEDSGSRLVESVWLVTMRAHRNQIQRLVTLIVMIAKDVVLLGVVV